jgi:hypothetical protein
LYTDARTLLCVLVLVDVGQVGLNFNAVEMQPINGQMPTASWQVLSAPSSRRPHLHSLCNLLTFACIDANSAMFVSENN